MLRDVVTAFANLSVHKEFLRAVAASSYYEKPVFAKALAIQHRIRIVSEVRSRAGVGLCAVAPCSHADRAAGYDGQV